MNEIFQLKIVIHYIVECVENKITKIIDVNQIIIPWRSGFGIILKIKVENHITG